MKVITSTENLELGVLPAKVLLLLSKYAHELKRHNGFILKLSSQHVMRDLHYANALCDSAQLNSIYDEIVLEVNIYLAEQETR